jgi:hypothetical protein
LLMYEGQKQAFLDEISFLRGKHCQQSQEFEDLVKLVMCNMNAVHIRPLYIDIMLRWTLFRAKFVELEAYGEGFSWPDGNIIDGFVPEVFLRLRRDDFRVLRDDESVGSEEIPLAFTNEEMLN